MDLKADLLALASGYCDATGMSQARLATIIANDGKFLARIARGGDFTARTYERAMRWFDGHWPPRAEWPRAVRRPTAIQPAAAVERAA